MVNFNKVFDDIKDQVGGLAEKDLKDFSSQGKQDGEAFLTQSRGKLEKWMQLLAVKKSTRTNFAGW